MLARAALIALSAALAGPAAADPRSEALLRAFIENVDASPDWSASASLIRSDGAATVGEGLVFSRGEPEVSVSIERLSLGDLSERDGGGFTASTIEMTGGAIISAVIDYQVPSASVRDVATPDVAGISFDPHRLMTSMSQMYSAMAAVEFADLRIPEMTGTQRQVRTADGGPSSVRVAYRAIESGGIEGGVLQDMRAGPLSFAVAQPDGAEIRFEVQSLVSERTDIGALAHIFDVSRYGNGRGDEVWRPVLSRVAYSGMTGSGPDGASFRLNDMAIESVDGRQPEEPFTATWDKLLDPDVPEERKSDLALDALREMYSAWRVGTMRMEGLAAEAPAENSKFSLAGMTITGLSTEGLDSFILKDMRGESSQGFGKLDSFELAGLVFPDMRAMVDFAALEEDADSSDHADTMRATFAALPRIGRMAATGIAGGESEAKAVSLDRFALELRDWNEIYAQSTGLDIEGLRVPRELLTLDPAAAEIVDALGYDEFVLGMSFADRWSAGSGTDDGRWTFTMRDAGDVELAYTLTGITVDWLLRATAAAGNAENSQAALMVMLAELGLRKATLKLTDRSILDRGFGAAAKKQNLDVTGPAYREQLRGALPFLLSAALTADLSKLLSAPLQAFMAGGQTIVAEIAPASPIPLPEIFAGAADPTTLPQKLGVTLRTEPAAE